MRTMFVNLYNTEPKNLNGTVLKLTNDEENLFLCETTRAATVGEARKYIVIDETGSLAHDGFAVLNNIPIKQEGRDIFEARFLNRSRKIEQEPGFLAIRILKPLESETYIILTLWENEAAFKNWQHSEAYAHQHRKRGTSEGIDQQHASIFAGPTYVKTYHSIPTN